MQKILLTLLLNCLIYFSSSAQYSITGQVFNKETNLPMQGASVFAQNTTIGTATDAEGNFKLYLPNGGYDIVVTFTGFQSESKRVSAADAGEKQTFVLKAKEKELMDVMVVASGELKDGWQRYGSFFTEEFIGKSANATHCSIKNPEVLKFYFSKKRNRLKVLANEPLIVENKALGYNIRYSLDSFTHEYNSQVSLYTGYPLFEELTASSDEEYRQWQAARSKAYSGSMLHFMRSLYNRRLTDEGFEIQFVIKTNDQEKALKLKDYYNALNYQKDDSAQIVQILPNQPGVAVIYTKEKPSEKFIAENPGEPKDFELSMLNFLTKDPLVIEQNGYFYDQYDLSIGSYWAWNKVAEQLPYDFTPASF